jgi:HlyD family secretion protein
VRQSAKNVRNHRARRWVPYLGGVVLLGALAAGLWPKPVPVELASACVGTLRATVNEEGKTRIKQRYIVSAPVTGHLRRIPYKAGAEVVADQTVLGIIDPVSPTLLDMRTRASAEARRDVAAANVEKFRAALTYAASELKRMEKLFAEQTLSAQELEAGQWRESSAAKELAAAQSALRQAEAELAEFSSATGNPQPAVGPPRQITSPTGGRVLRVFEENARVVTAGTPLVEVGDPAELEVVVEVLSRDGAAIRAGAHVDFEQWGGGEPLQGRVRLVEPAAFTKISALGVEEQRVNVIADLLTPPEQRPNVGDQFRVDAKIVVWEATNALKVPAGALFRRGDKWATFVVQDGRARFRPVQVGRSSSTETQVLDGLKPGERVIIYPGSRVHEGDRVRPITL